MEERIERSTLSFNCDPLLEMPKLPTAPSKRSKVRGGTDPIVTEPITTEPIVQEDPGAYVPTPPQLIVDSVKFRLIDDERLKEMLYDKPSRLRKTFPLKEVEAINNFIAQLTIEGGAKRKKASRKAK